MNRSTDAASPAIRAAAVLYVLLNLGFGVGAAVTLAAFARNGEAPMTPWGFRSMVGGPFDRLGPGAFIPLGSALVGVCALQGVAGAWLWQGRRRGARLALATTPLAVALGVGFALPFFLLGQPIGAALVMAGRRSLK